jgi:hypothetical protein
MIKININLEKEYKKMELTKEQNRIRKECILKFHPWFGVDVLKEVFKDYDYYNDDESRIVYVYRKQ